MKIRNGFVSNSSSSSFIVNRIDWSNQNKLVLSKEESKLLEDYGFKPSWTSYPDQEHDLASKEENFVTYYYSTLCNEDNELNFLIKNKISFQASCHYDHYTVIYDRKEDKIVSIKNFGHLYLMGDKYFNEKDRTFKIISREDWLAGKEYYTF